MSVLIFQLLGQIASEKGKQDISIWDAIVDLGEEDTAMEPGGTWCCDLKKK